MIGNELYTQSQLNYTGAKQHFRVLAGMQIFSAHKRSLSDVTHDEEI